MNAFWVLVCGVIVSVSARPDVSLGYHYNPDYNSGSNLLAPPVSSTSYFPTASGSIGAVNPGGFDSGAATSSSGSANFLAPDYNVAGVSSASSASSSASNFNGFSSASTGSSSFASSGSSGGVGFSGGNSDGGDSGFGSGNAKGQGFIGGGASSQSFAGGANQGYVGSSGGEDQQYAPQYQPQPPIITKHFYIHSAPEDHDNQEIVKYITIGRPTKNYRVVFINAPSSTSTKAKIIANVAPVEDRTAIYVLSKKANELDISADVVTPAPTGPNKPDVYFIKYKTPEEAIHAQHVIQAQYDKLGGSSDISNEGNVPVQSVVGSVGGQSNAASSSSAQISSQGVGFQPGPASQGQQIQQVQQIQQIQQSGNTQPQANYLPPPPSSVYRRRRYYSYRY